MVAEFTWLGPGPTRVGILFALSHCTFDPSLTPCCFPPGTLTFPVCPGSHSGLIMTAAAFPNSFSVPMTLLLTIGSHPLLKATWKAGGLIGPGSCVYGSWVMLGDARWSRLLQGEAPLVITRCSPPAKANGNKLVGLDKSPQLKMFKSNCFLH